MSKSTFNSFLDSDAYDLIKMDAIRNKVNVKNHISNILKQYAEKLKEKEILFTDKVIITE
jgi:hypothetical protein